MTVANLVEKKENAENAAIKMDNSADVLQVYFDKFLGFMPEDQKEHFSTLMDGAFQALREGSIRCREYRDDLNGIMRRTEIDWPPKSRGMKEE